MNRSEKQEADTLAQLTHLTRFAQSMYDANPSNPVLSIMNIADQEVQVFLRSLHQYRVKYLLVGGIATVFHGYVRTTLDLDLWVQEVPENKKRLVQALEAVGVAGADHYELVEMIPGWSTLTIGDRGFVADFMGYTKAFAREDFDECYQRAERATFKGTPITIIQLDDLIREKKALGRTKDTDDVENLERIKASKERH